MGTYLRHKFLSNMGANESCTTADADSDNTIRSDFLGVGSLEFSSAVVSHVAPFKCAYDELYLPFLDFWIWDTLQISKCYGRAENVQIFAQSRENRIRSTNTKLRDNQERRQDISVIFVICRSFLETTTTTTLSGEQRAESREQRAEIWELGSWILAPMSKTIAPIIPIFQSHHSLSLR